MTDDELQAIKARAERSTPDLQYGTVTDDDSLQKEDVIFTFAEGRVATLHHNPSITTLQMCDNGGFFTTARPDILALIAEVGRLRKALERLGSCEAFTFAMAINSDDPREEELRARLDFARDAMK